MVIRRNLVHGFEAVEPAIDLPAHRNASDTRHHEMRQPDVITVGGDSPDRGNSEPEIHFVDLEFRRLIFVLEKTVLAIRLENLMQKVEVSGVAIAVEGLQVITFQKTLGDVDLVLGNSEPRVGWKYRFFVARSHVS